MLPTKALNPDNITLVSRLSALLVTGAFVASLFFNGIDLRFFALTFILLIAALINTTIVMYRQGSQIGNLLIPVTLLLFWLWLGISNVFSPVIYLSTVNFWWIGIFPSTFLIFYFSDNKDALYKYTFALIAIVTFLLCIYALYQLFVLHEQPRATFFNKNSLAALVNLQIFPLLAVTLLTHSRKRLILLFVAIFTFALLLGIINSRGALLAFMFSLIVMLVLTVSARNKRRMLLPGLLVVAALFTAQLVLPGTPQATESGILESISTLQDTDSAGRSRFVIWQPAWELFKQNTWTGIGLGTYFLTIPPYLHPDDHSAGYYVHNDYLQIGLEAGLPGLILLLAILLSVLYRFTTTINRTPKQEPARLIFVALFSAMLSLAIHSFFTFNLYIMPTMLVLGLILGHFNYLADRLQSISLKQWQPSSLFRPLIYYLCLAAVTFSLLSYIVNIGIAHHYQQKANRLAAKNQLEDAHLAFRLAQILAPRIDSAYFADANLLRKSALVVADTHPAFASNLLQEALDLLAQAEALNALRPHTPYIRGLVLEQAVPTNQAEILDTYQTALHRNPRFIPARLALARYLIKLERTDGAEQVLQAGLEYSYRDVTPAYLELIDLNYSVAVHMGNSGLAQNLSALLDKYQQVYNNKLTDKRQSKIINPY